MIYNFRQGIASYPKTGSLQQFLIKSGNFVTLNVSPSSLVQILFADGEVDYLLDESVTINKAWGPLPVNTETWIYWDISTLTGVRTFGFTLYEPVYGPTAPTSPQIDQHWFDTTNTRMFVFNGNRWVKKIRVFASKVLNNTFTPLGSELLTAPFAGTQVELGGDGYEVHASYILYDSHGKPISKQSGEFLRAGDEFLIQGSHVTHVNIESYVLRLMADEPIARYYVAKVVGENHAVLATYDDIQNAVLAVCVEDLTLYGTGAFVLQGVITNLDWNWSDPPGTPLWIKESGNFVTIDPHVSDVLTYPDSRPPVARILNKTSVVFTQGMGGKGDRGLPGQGGGGSGDMDPATTASLGIVRISVTPTDPDNPIAVGTNDPRMSDARIPLSHEHEISDVNELQEELDGKAPLNHTHAISSITGLQAALDNKSNVGHSHAISDIVGLQQELDEKLSLTGGTMLGTLVLAGDPIGPLEATTKQYVDQAIADAIEGDTTGSGITFAVNQTDHGFVVGTPVFYDGSTWQKAIANSDSTLAVAMVSQVTDVNNFIAQQAGTISGLDGLVPGEYYFTSSTIAGTITSDEPPLYSNPILFAISTTTGLVLPYRPSLTDNGGSGGEYNGTWIGTTFIDFDRPPEPMELTGILSIDGSAARLTTPRTINGVPFDGTADIEIPSIAANVVLIEAGENLAKGTPVFVDNNRVYAADYNDTPTVLGIVLENVTGSFLATIVTFGPITLTGLLTAGAVYYLGVGTISSTPPTNKYVIRLGTAISPNTLLVNVEPSIYLT